MNNSIYWVWLQQRLGAGAKTAELLDYFEGDIKALFEAEAPGIDGAPAEVILALGGDVEGETTAFYIYRQISQYGVTVSSLARGLGFGDNLEYADELTLGRSIINRQIFKP